MKRVAIIVAALITLAAFSAAQTGGTQPGASANPQAQSPAQNRPGQSQAGQASAPAAQQPAAPAAKRQPAAKTQEEYKAFQDAAVKTDPAALETAANEFAAKFPDSELRGALYQRAMGFYQQANNVDKTIEMGTKVLQYDPDSPAVLANLASVLAERTRDTDLDRDEKLGKATSYAQHALQTVDTSLAVPANVTPEQLAEFKDIIRSMAYAALGQVDLVKGNNSGAEAQFRKAVDVTKNKPDPWTMLKLTLVLDRQKKYPDALAMADRTLQVAQPGTQEANLAKQERERLVKLAGAPGAGTPGTATPAAGSPSTGGPTATGTPTPKPPDKPQTQPSPTPR